MIINGEKIRLGDQMCFRFYTLSRLVIQTYEPYFKKIGITYTQYLVLIVLWEQDERPINDICSKLLLGINTVSPLIKRMESSGLVGRHGSETDKRKQIVFLTEKGRLLEKTISEARMEMLNSLEGSDVLGERLLQIKPTLDEFISYFSNYEQLCRHA